MFLHFLKCVPDSKPETINAHQIKMSFFTYPTLTEICRRLVTHYFVLHEEERAMWEEDPEGFGKYIPLVFCCSLYLDSFVEKCKCILRFSATVLLLLWGVPLYFSDAYLFTYGMSLWEM